jgi:hypothetical protein
MVTKRKPVKPRKPRISKQGLKKSARKKRARKKSDTPVEPASPIAPTPDAKSDTPQHHPFPASESTPGQRASRLGYAVLDGKITDKTWSKDYYYLLDRGVEWRTAVFIAWASCPIDGREPRTQAELAKNYLLLRSDRVIRKWRKLNPEIDRYISEMKAAPLLRYRESAFRALGEVASLIDPAAHGDRELFFKMTGDYNPKAALTLTGPQGGAIQTLDLGVLADLNETELDQFTRNLETAIRSDALGATPPATSGVESKPSSDAQPSQP